MDRKKPNLNEITEKIADTAGAVWEKTLLLKDAAQEKARILTQKARLRSEASKNSSRIERLYADLGSLYYCMRKDDPDEQMKQMCEEITVLLDRNEELERLLAELKQIEDPGVEQTFSDGEDVTDETTEDVSAEGIATVGEGSEESPGLPL